MRGVTDVDGGTVGRGVWVALGDSEAAVDVELD